MKIIKLTAENVKRLQAVEITPDGNLVIIGGDNAQGKSSTIDCIAMAVGGKELIPKEPIRRGAEKARIQLDLGELIVTRTFTEKGSEVKVTDKDGTKIAGPQTILDKLYSAVTFDPLAFAHKEPKEQAKILRQLLGIDQIIGEHDAKEKTLFDKRQEVNRDVKRLQGELTGKTFHKTAPTEPVITADLVKQIEAETAKTSSYTEAENQIVRWNTEINRWRLEIQKKAKELEDANAALATAQAGMDAAKSKLNTLEPGDTEQLQEQIASAEADNQKYRDNQAHEKTKNELEEKEAEAEGLTAGIEKVRTAKADLIKKAKFPVAGLGFSDDGVLFNGLPLEQASGAETLRVSVGIGAALNPKLRVLLSRDGSLLDSKNLKALGELAKEHDLQVWLERVGDKDECAVIIEDGMVRE